jgi:hypothetical protein
LAEKPESHAATEQKNPDQDAYDCQFPNAGKQHYERQNDRQEASGEGL